MDGIEAKIREKYCLPAGFQLASNSHRISTKNGVEVHNFSFTFQIPPKKEKHKPPSKARRDQFRLASHLLNGGKPGKPVTAPLLSRQPIEAAQPPLVAPPGNVQASSSSSSSGSSSISKKPGPTLRSSTSAATNAGKPASKSSTESKMSDSDDDSLFIGGNFHALYVDQHIALKSDKRVVVEPELSKWTPIQRTRLHNGLGADGSIVSAHDHSTCLKILTALETDDPATAKRLWTKLMDLLG
jgi:hypothetical protein